jgi:hypothetical protein
MLVQVKGHLAVALNKAVAFSDGANVHHGSFVHGAPQHSERLHHHEKRMQQQTYFVHQPLGLCHLIWRKVQA